MLVNHESTYVIIPVTTLTSKLNFRLQKPYAFLLLQPKKNHHKPAYKSYSMILTSLQPYAEQHDPESTDTLLNPRSMYVERAALKIQDMIHDLNKKSLRAGKLASRDDREFQLQLENFLSSFKQLRHEYLAVPDIAESETEINPSPLARSDGNNGEPRAEEALQQLWIMESTVTGLTQKLRTAIIAEVPTVNEIIKVLRSAIETP